MANIPIDFVKPMREAVYDALDADATLKTLLGSPAGAEWFHDRRYDQVKLWPSISFQVMTFGQVTSGTARTNYRPRIEFITYSTDPDVCNDIMFRLKALLEWPDTASGVAVRLDMSDFRVDSLLCETVLTSPVPARRTESSGEVFALPSDWQCSLKQIT